MPKYTKYEFGQLQEFHMEELGAVKEEAVAELDKIQRAKYELIGQILYFQNLIEIAGLEGPNDA